MDNGSYVMLKDRRRRLKCCVVYNKGTLSNTVDLTCEFEVETDVLVTLKHRLLGIRTVETLL